MNSEARIQELEAKVNELTALVERMAPALRGATTPDAPPQIDTTAVELAEPPTSSRRGMLKLAGAAAAGAAAVAVAGHASPAAAADGDPWLLGTSNTASSDTILTSKMWALAASDSTADILTGISGTIIGWDVSNSTSGSRAGVVGYSGPFFSGGNTPHGVMGIVASNSGTGSGVYGRSNSDVVGASAGVRALSDNGPAVQMVPVFSGAPTSGTWTVGALLPDTAGNLWYCVAGGSPGSWRKVSGASTAGAFHALSPGRVYDSRAALPFQGAIIGGNNRTITVADKRDTTTGAVTTADFVPVGATAVAANITIVSLSGAGFLTVNPGGTTTVGASTINWSAPGQVLANGVTLTLNTDRQLTIVAGGGGSTEFIVDISGYYL